MKPRECNEDRVNNLKAILIEHKDEAFDPVTKTIASSSSEIYKKLSSKCDYSAKTIYVIVSTGRYNVNTIFSECGKFFYFILLATLNKSVSSFSAKGSSISAFCSGSL